MKGTTGWSLYSNEVAKVAAIAGGIAGGCHNAAVHGRLQNSYCLAIYLDPFT